MAQSSIIVCFALKEEAAPFRKIAAAKLTRISQINTDFLIRENSCNPCQKSGISILLTGIGRQNAEKSVREFLAANLPELVLTCGFVGGLNPDLKLGDMIFESGKRKAESGNLDFYCKAFGIESPKSAGVTGSDVTAMLAEKKFRKIAEYCLRDVRATVELYKIWKERLAGIK
jgi:nucleoside phosphorylase